MAKVLAGKTALVTGGTSGIGRAVAAAFAGAGANVAVCGRRSAEGERTVCLVEEAGAQGFFCPADVTQSDEVEAFVHRTVEKFGRLDIAFNNAGVTGRGAIVDTDDDDFDRVFNANVRGVWLSMKYEIRQFLAQGTGGVVINNSSIYGRWGRANASHYVAAKHAVEGYTKAAAIEYASEDIRVNAVAPGAVVTELNEDYFTTDPSAIAYIQDYPAKRLAVLDDIVGAVVFLASDAARYINGTSVPIDGGFSAG